MTTRRTCHRAAAVLALLVCGAGPAQAGPFADELGRCLTAAVTPEDKAALGRWVFANSALHPDLGAVSAVSAAQRDGYNRAAAAVLQRLVTENCRKATQDTLRGEGPGALQLAFTALGQSAMQELLNHPNVGRGFADTARYLDPARLLELTFGR